MWLIHEIKLSACFEAFKITLFLLFRLIDLPCTTLHRELWSYFHVPITVPYVVNMFRDILLNQISAHLKSHLLFIQNYAFMDNKLVSQTCIPCLI